MKTLGRLFFVTLLVIAVSGGWLRSSPYWTLLEIHQGISTRDVDRVERVVALERFAASSAAALGAAVGNELGGRVEGGGLLGTIAELVGRGVGEAVAKDAARGLRQAIAEGALERKVGPLEVNEGFAAIGRVASTIDGAQVELLGTCDGSPAGIVLEFERHDGAIAGHPRSFVLVGIEPGSAKQLAKRCVASSSSAASSSSSSSKQR
jgi:hypothetical protein